MDEKRLACNGAETNKNPMVGSHLAVSINEDTPIAGWFIKIRKKIDDLEVPHWPISGNLHFSIDIS